MAQIKPLEIGFDIDGVVADTMASFFKVAREEFGIDTMRLSDIICYWIEECVDIPKDILDEILHKLVYDPFATDLRPMPGAKETLKSIAQHGTINFVTARPVVEPIYEWLVYYLDGVPKDRINVIATGRHNAKAEQIHKLGLKYFLEDHFETCVCLYEKGINSIVYDQPWNQGNTPFLRISNWKELHAIIFQN
jgi:5'(3')-deoxyribonucleotidase